MRALHGCVDFLQHDRLYLRTVRGLSGSATPSWPPRLVHEALRPPLALPVASEHPDISSEQPFNEMSVQVSGRRVTATRVLDFCRLG